MSLRGEFFAMVYDRQLAAAKKAGLRAMRERLLAAAPPLTPSGGPG